MRTNAQLRKRGDLEVNYPNKDGVQPLVIYHLKVDVPN
jgi:hypothetical protein